MNHGHHRQLADFVQKSWSELPAGGRNHYMKPHFQVNSDIKHEFKVFPANLRDQVLY